STHSWSVSRHAASSGSAAFLFPSTETDPERRWPPSISSVDIELPEVDDLVAQLDAEALAHDGAAPFDEPPDVAGGGAARVDDEVAVRRRHTRPADRGAFEAGAIDERSSRPRHPLGQAVPIRLRILEDAPGARRIERLRRLAVRERLARDGPERGRIARRDAERRPEQDFARALQAAAIVAEAHVGRFDGARLAVARGHAHGRDVLADVAAGEMRVAEDRAADGARGAGPGLQSGGAVVDRPAHQAGDRHGGVRAHVGGVDGGDLASAR